MKLRESELSPEFALPEPLWALWQRVLPPPRPKRKPGRPAMPDRQAAEAIYYVLRTGCQWKALPRSLGAGSTVHDRFTAWRRAGVFERLWQAALAEYDEAAGIAWLWQAVDGAMTKAPLGGKRDRAEPDRPSQAGHQAQPVDRRAGGAAGGGRGGRQPQRPPAAGRDARAADGLAAAR